MIIEHKQYYEKMVEKGRLIPFVSNGVLHGFLTFYITNNETNFNNSDPWAVLEDNPEGNIVYIAQLITNKDPDNVRLIHRHYSGFIKYIKENFKNVNTVYWRQWDFKKKVLKVFKKEI